MQLREKSEWVKAIKKECNCTLLAGVKLFDLCYKEGMTKEQCVETCFYYSLDSKTRHLWFIG